MHKEIRKAVDSAERAGLAVTKTSGHTWGYISCRCGINIPVYSTGKAPEKGARLIRNFIRKHQEHQR